MHFYFHSPRWILGPPEETDPLWLTSGMPSTFTVKKLELIQFLLDHGIAIINETHLVPGQDFWVANCVCHKNHHPTPGEGTTILVSCGIDNRALHLGSAASGIHCHRCKHCREASQTHGSLPIPTVILAYADLSECISGRKPDCLASGLNTKHIDSNSMVKSPRG